MRVGGFSEPLFSALWAGVLSFASPKESSQRKGDPEGGAGFAGSLRYSAGRAPCLNSPAAQTRQAEIPRPACVAQRLPRGPEKRPGSTVFPQKAGFHDHRNNGWPYGQPGKAAKNQILRRRTHAQSPSLPRRQESRRLLDSRLRGNGGTQAQTWLVSPGPLRGAEQRRGWRKKGEDCLRAQPEFRSPRQSRVAQGTGAAGTDPGSPSFCLLFLGEARKSETPRKGGTPSQSKPPVGLNTTVDVSMLPRQAGMKHRKGAPL